MAQRVGHWIDDTARLETRVFWLNHLPKVHQWLGNTLPWVLQRRCLCMKTLLFLRWKAFYFKTGGFCFHFHLSHIAFNMLTTKGQDLPSKNLAHSWSDPWVYPIFLHKSHFLFFLSRVMTKSSFQVPNTHGILPILLYQTVLIGKALVSLIAVDRTPSHFSPAISTLSHSSDCELRSLLL